MAPSPPSGSPETGTEPQGAARQAPGATLAGDLANFLIELSIALHKHGMYPKGHPLLAPTSKRLAQLLADLIHRRGTLSIGVAETQLIIEGVATDPNHSVLHDLAQRLHRHHLAVLTFDPGVTLEEVQEFLSMVGPDADSTGKPLGLGSMDAVQQPHIHLSSVAYDRIHLKEEDEEDRQIWEAASKGGDLWIGLARAALGDDADPKDLDNPSALATAIEGHGSDTAYDQVIVGYLMKIAVELKTAGGADARALRNRLAKLVDELDSAALRRLLRHGGDSVQRRALVLDASYGMEADTIVKLLDAAGEVEEETVSDYLLRMLQKIAHHAEGTAGSRQLLAEQSVREQVADIVQGWSLPSPNPKEYDRALADMARAKPIFRSRLEQEHRAEPRRIVEMALEVDVTGATVVDAMRQMAASDAVKWLLAILEEHEDSTVAQAVRHQLGDRDKLIRILQEDPLDTSLLDAVLPFIGQDAVEPMLEALIAAESRQTRRHLLDRLPRFGDAVVGAVVKYLEDDRWYVQRNMLTLLAELEQIPEGFDADRFLQHSDARVRREAVRLLLRRSETRVKAVCSALADSDERTARLALAAAATDCPSAAMSLVVSRAQSGSSETREAAIRVLAASDDRAALDGLIGLTEPTRKLFRWKHPAKTGAYLLALRGLARRAGDPAADRVLALARRRRDPEISAAAAGEETVS